MHSAYGCGKILRPSSIQGLPGLTFTEKKELARGQLFPQVALEDCAGAPAVLLAVGVALLGVPDAAHVGVVHEPVSARGLLEAVGHLGSPSLGLP